jgi:putative endonuclease
MKSARHVAAQRRGRLAETLAAWRLRLAGWRIVARDLRLPAGQVDLVARRGRTLAFVEVKARDNADDAAESLHPAQCARIERAAEQYLAGRPQFAAFEIRFDLVLVAPASWPRHVKDAWRDSRRHPK